MTKKPSSQAALDADWLFDRIEELTSIVRNPQINWDEYEGVIDRIGERFTPHLDKSPTNRERLEAGLERYDTADQLMPRAVLEVADAAWATAEALRGLSLDGRVPGPVCAGCAQIDAQRRAERCTGDDDCPLLSDSGRASEWYEAIPPEDDPRLRPDGHLPGSTEGEQP